MKDWVEWHAGYADADSELSRRLGIVQRLLGEALDAIGEGASLISMCAGEGRDVVGVLRDRPQAVARALLVELDEALVAACRQAVHEAGLDEVVTVRHGDAGRLSAYADAAPADVVLACGVFGNISDEDVFATIDALPGLVRPGGRVLWTRTRREPDLTPRIRAHLAERGFREVGFVAPEGLLITVGAALYEGQPRPLDARARLFTFLV